MKTYLECGGIVPPFLMEVIAQHHVLATLPLAEEPLVPIRCIAEAFPVKCCNKLICENF
jgi:hypothetical protein